MVDLPPNGAPGEYATCARCWTATRRISGSGTVVSVRPGCVNIAGITLSGGHRLRPCVRFSGGGGGSVRLHKGHNILMGVEGVREYSLKVQFEVFKEIHPSVSLMAVLAYSSPLPAWSLHWHGLHISGDPPIDIRPWGPPHLPYVLESGVDVWGHKLDVKAAGINRLILGKAP